MTTYTLGGGCFWCIDAVYRRLKGVLDTTCGYAGGYATDPPSYYNVSQGETGHAEVVRVNFDETLIPPDTILDIFFTIHDPTSFNRQGADIGSQYRSIMLYKDEAQKQQFQAAIKRAEKIWTDHIVTELKPLDIFYKAEDEHQDYFSKHPESGYCTVVIEPKLTKARRAYTKWFKEEI